MNDEALLSIIVPAYNVEKYLAECLESILNQSLINHRIILVNDGSQDSTPEVCMEYANMYPDLITYVSQDNQGLGAARNTGLNYVDTPFVTFLDSDDWYGQLFVEKFTSLISRVEITPDIIIMLPWIFDAATNQYLDWHSRAVYERLFSETNYDKIQYLNTIICPELLSLEVSANSKIYKTSFLKKQDFKFQTGVRWEDVRPHFQLMHRANYIIALKDAGFYYRCNTSGQITSENGKTRLDSVTVFKDSLNMADELAFTDNEYSYLLRCICNYTKWNLDMVNDAYKVELLTKLHKLYLEVPLYRFKNYLNYCSPKKKKESIMICMLRTPLYRLLRDYWLKEHFVKTIKKVVYR